MKSLLLDTLSYFSCALLAFFLGFFIVSYILHLPPITISYTPIYHI